MTDTRPGIVSYGAYLPVWRLDRRRIGEALGGASGSGTRSVAAYDEDVTTMAVAAAACAVDAAPAGPPLGGVLLATADPPYLDKTNATVIHAALGLDPAAGAFDVGGAVRSGVGALLTAPGLGDRWLAILSDRRGGLPGGADESGGGDGAAAFLFGTGDSVVARPLGRGFGTAEFLERWRVPGADHARVWEERFGEHVYVPLGEQSFGAALKDAGLTPSDVDHLIVTGVHARAARRLRTSLGVRPDAVVDDLTGVVGNTGTAHPGVLLADVLDRAAPRDVVAVTVLADGAATLLWRATDALPAWRAARRPGSAVRDHVAGPVREVTYPTFLGWRGHLRREPPRRPDPVTPAAPPSFRREAWKFAFTASRCVGCGHRDLPPERVCLRCGAVDQMAPEPLAAARATVATFTVDRLAYTPNPPLVAVVLDFDGGGRYRGEMTDLDPDAVAVGDRVEMTFRLISVTSGIRNYFWKAKPVRVPERAEEVS